MHDTEKDNHDVEWKSNDANGSDTEGADDEAE